MTRSTTRLMTPSVAVGAVLLGAASGLRSQMGVAAAVVGSPDTGLPAALRHRAAGIIAITAACGELVVDKSPKTPDRTAPAGLSARVVLGAAAGAIVASVARQRLVVPAVVAGGTAVAAAFGGLRLRSRLAVRVSPLAAGVIEDLVAIQLAAAAMAVLSRSA
jgi:uncharacterized membrane protein